MIESWKAAGNWVVRVAELSGNYRELVNGAMVKWAPTESPRENVRRWAILEAGGSYFMRSGNSIVEELREWFRTHYRDAA